MTAHHRKDRNRADAAQRYLEPLRRYQATAARLFPGSGASPGGGEPVSSADALFLGYLLDRLPEKGTVLELGPGTGALTLCLASHPRVSKVVSVSPNRPAADVARAVAEEHPEQRQKILFLESPANGIPAAAQKELRNGRPLVVAGGFRAREEVARCLKAVYDGRPEALVVLGGCRGADGPFVQAGAVDLLEERGEEYRLRMVGDLGPALAASGLAVVYPRRAAAEMEEALREVGRQYNLDLDPLRLLARAEELNEAVGELGRQRDDLAGRISRLEQEVLEKSEQESRLRGQIADLRERNEALNARVSGRRYKAADAAADRLLRLPGVGKLLRDVPGKKK